MKLSGAAALLSCVVVAVALSASSAAAQERPYFVTYNDWLEDPGEVELSVLATGGPACCDSGRYVAPWLEIEYGVASRWTAELYLEGVAVAGDRSAFSGWRLENRFRPLAAHHAINPVLYVEYESVNEASRIQKEIVGSGPLARDPIASLVEEHAHELEGRVILSSDIGAWNVSENLIVEKNLSAEEGLEFGYAAGVSRGIGRHWTIGAEAYGGLGSTLDATLADARHFVAPVVAWHPTHASVLRVSVGFGLSASSDSHVLRVGYSVDVR